MLSKNRVFTLFLALILSLSLCTAAYAHDVPDLDRTGEISVTMKEDGKTVSGGSLTLYRVGEVVENDGDYAFALTAELENAGIALDDLQSASLAEKLAEEVEDSKLEGTTQTIDKDGEAVFADLELGLYLAVQNKAASGYEEADPFLITLPMYDGEVYQYQVDASPKVQLEQAEDIPDDEDEDDTDTPDDKLPQTGQLDWPVPVLAMAGLFLLVVGVALRRKGQENRNEE